MKPGRYFDVWNHSAGEDDYNACYLHVGLYHGFFQTVADTPLFRNALTLEGDGDACEDPYGSTPLMSHLRPDEPDEVIRTAVRDSDRDLKLLRRQCKNTLHVACEVFAKHDLRALWLVVNPFKYSHGSIIKKFKSNDDTLAWHLGNWTRVLLRATSVLANRQLFVQAGLTRWSLASPAIFSFDDETSGKIARAVVNFWSHYVADEIRTNRSYSDALPGKFAAVLQDDPAKVAQELMILREWLDILEEFEIAMDGNEWFWTFHQSLIFPVSRWVRFVLIGLAEGRDCVPSDLELFHTFGISGTDIIENSRPLQLRAESDTLAPHTVSPDIFNASKCKCSLGDKLLSRFLEHCDGDAWPHPSPQASLLIFESWYLLRSFRGIWGNLQHAWRSLLAMLGWVLYHRTDKIGYFVLQSSRYSCVTWLPCIRSHGSVYFIRLGAVDDATAAEAPWQQLHLTALDEWRVMIPRPLTHAQAERLFGDAALPGITLVFMPGEESKPLLRTAAETAF